MLPVCIFCSIASSDLQLRAFLHVVEVAKAHETCAEVTAIYDSYLSIVIRPGPVRPIRCPYLPSQEASCMHTRPAAAAPERHSPAQSDPPEIQQKASLHISSPSVKGTLSMDRATRPQLVSLMRLSIGSGGLRGRVRADLSQEVRNTPYVLYSPGNLREGTDDQRLCSTTTVHRTKGRKDLCENRPIPYHGKKTASNQWHRHASEGQSSVSRTDNTPVTAGCGPWLEPPFLNPIGPEPMTSVLSCVSLCRPSEPRGGHCQRYRGTSVAGSRILSFCAHHALHLAAL